VSREIGSALVENVRTRAESHVIVGTGRGRGQVECGEVEQHALDERTTVMMANPGVAFRRNRSPVRRSAV
jgi:hypothetical protein